MCSEFLVTVMTRTNVAIYEVGSEYLFPGGDTVVRGRFILMADDPTGFLLGQGNDPAKLGKTWSTVGDISSIHFYGQDRISIEGLPFRVKSLQMTIDGATRSFVIEDNGSEMAIATEGAQVTLLAEQPFKSQTSHGAPAFVAGSVIETARGLVPVEGLRPEDLIKTQAAGYQKTTAVESYVVTRAELAADADRQPVCLKRDALGPGLPHRDLMLHPDLRVRHPGWVGQHETTRKTPRVFSSASELPVASSDPKAGVLFVLPVFAQPHVVRLNGLWVECPVRSASMTQRIRRISTAHIAAE